MLITFIIFAVLAVVGFIVAKAAKFQTAAAYQRPSEPTTLPNKIIALGSVALLIVGVLFFAGGSFFTQDVGDASVQKDITGNIVGQTNETGFHVKAPWIDVVTFNIRNQQVVFAGKTGEQNNNAGGEADGPQITVQDADGVTSNVDIALRYSIKPDSVTAVYKQFKTEENFKKSFIDQDVRSVVRLVPNGFSTIDLLTKRGEVENAIQKALEERWADDGVTVDSISLQEIRPPKSVVESYAAAQQAQINVTKEQANLDAVKVSAQQKVAQAQAESDANAILNASLSPSILQQRYLDTLKELAKAGNLVVVPENFNGLVNVGK